MLNGRLTTGARAGEIKMYKHFLDTMLQIVKQEGIPQLWRGVVPMVLRGSLLNAGHTLGYDYTKTAALSGGHLPDGL